MWSACWRCDDVIRASEKNTSSQTTQVHAKYAYRARDACVDTSTPCYAIQASFKTHVYNFFTKFLNHLLTKSSWSWMERTKMTFAMRLRVQKICWVPEVWVAVRFSRWRRIKTKNWDRNKINRTVASLRYWKLLQLPGMNLLHDMFSKYVHVWLYRHNKGEHRGHSDRFIRAGSCRLISHTYTWHKHLNYTRPFSSDVSSSKTWSHTWRSYKNNTEQSHCTLDENKYMFTYMYTLTENFKF